MQKAFNVAELPLANKNTQHPEIIDKFISVYQMLNKDNLHLLEDIYRPNIQFQDPLHLVNGLHALTGYFADLYQNVTHIDFDIHAVNLSQDGQQASLFWVMSYCHPKLNKGKIIKVDGTSLLKFDEKIFYHRDYFDAGQMLYQHVPLLGSLINLLKKRLG
ncbi:nuclear transport factor 2 family protein [Shewanella gaetbuli]